MAAGDLEVGKDHAMVIKEEALMAPCSFMEI